MKIKKINEIEDVRETFQDFSDKITDHRINRNKLHPVSEILYLVLCATICGSEGWRDIERYGKSKLTFLRGFFEYKHGIPSDDTLRRFFRNLDPANFQKCFAEWAKTLDLDANKHFSIDGKVSRRTHDGNSDPLHTVTAFASDCRMVMGQEKVDTKSNEITAIPKLLELLDIENGVVTIDAMGCQFKIAAMIREKKADYVLTLKHNQKSLHGSCWSLFKDEEALKKYEVATYKTTDGSEHGRHENRIYQVANVPNKIKQKHPDWVDLNSFIRVTSIREVKGKISEEIRYYISSMLADAEKIGKAIRSHWAVENSLHWILDVSFNDDQSRIRKGNAPQNMVVIKHFALNLLQKSKKPRESIKQNRKAAGWDDEYLTSIVKHI